MDRGLAKQQKDRLEAELAADLELIQAAHRAKLRALDVLMLTMPEEEAAAKPAQPASTAKRAPRAPRKPRRKGRRSRSRKGKGKGTSNKATAVSASPLNGRLRQVRDQVMALPHEFSARELRDKLADMDRVTVHRALKQLEEDNIVRLTQRGQGRRPARYEKIQQTLTEPA